MGAPSSVLSAWRASPLDDIEARDQLEVLNRARTADRFGGGSVGIGPRVIRPETKDEPERTLSSGRTRRYARRISLPPAAT